MQEKTKQEIYKFCDDNKIHLISFRNIKKSGKARIVVSVFCRECNSRYDVKWDTLKQQVFPGLCTKCAHSASWKERRLDLEKIIEDFEKEGFKVITPIKDIKPKKIKGYNKPTFNKTNILIEDDFGVQYFVCRNNFLRDIEKFRALNTGGYDASGHRKLSSLKKIVADFLNEQNIPFKREFKITDCRGNKRCLPFDFCLNFNKENKKLIEVDGGRHFQEYFKETQRNDKIKDYYCKTHHVPLLRIPYWQIDDGTFKEKILSFYSEQY